MPYSLDLTDTWDSIRAKLLSEFPGVHHSDEGVLDDEEVPTFSNGTIKPFFITWMRGLHRSPTVRSYSGTRLDGYYSGFDLVVVANNGKDSISIMNQANDVMIGFKPFGAGQLTKGAGLYDGAKAIKNSELRPSRFATTERFDFQVSQINTSIPAPIL